MLTVPEAVREISEGIQPREIERVPLLDVLGRVLATNAIAPYTLPQWDNSAMDGYAVRAADIEAATADHRNAVDGVAVGDHGAVRRGIDGGGI